MRLHPRAFRLLVTLFFFLPAGFAVAQTEPDTVRRKSELPTGPGQVPTQERPQQQAPVRQQPPAQQPQVQQRAPQALENPSLMDRLYTGGGFGLQFGSFTNISLSPILGYMATEKFWFGGGLIYQYQNLRMFDIYGRPMGRSSRQNYGAKIFAQQEVLNLEQSFLNGRILVHGEYEVLNLQYEGTNAGGQVDKFRRVATTPLIGLGYRQAIGARATADLYVLYNLSNSIYTPYSNPVFRFGFNIPFRR